MFKRILRKVAGRVFKNITKLEHKVGRRYYSNSLVDTLVPKFVEIGNNFISAPGSIILAHDASLFLFTKKYRIQKTIIGNNVFLGANSVILPGIIIEDNVIVGAGSIVTKDIKSNSVVAGNPAKYMCSIDEYIAKCENNDWLYETTSAIRSSFDKGEPFNAEILDEFRRSVDSQYKNRYDV